MSDPSGGQDLKTPKPPDSAMWLGERKVKKLTSSPTSRKLYFRGGGGITGGPTGPRNSKANTLIHSKFRTDHEYNVRFLSGCMYREKGKRQVQTQKI
jgi:hypothetical protein